MKDFIFDEPMLEMFLFETNQQIEALEQVVMESESNNSFTEAATNDIFRIMHTIKGSSAMMLYNNISTLAHSIEDLFFFIRENKGIEIDVTRIIDFVLEFVDFTKVEIHKIKNKSDVDGESGNIITTINAYLDQLKNGHADVVTREEDTQVKRQYYIPKAKASDSLIYYNCKIKYEQDCQMENIRAFKIVHSLNDIAEEVYHFPAKLVEDDTSSEFIRENGFELLFSSENKAELDELLESTAFIEKLELLEISIDEFEEIKKIFSTSIDKEIPYEEEHIEETVDEKEITDENLPQKSLIEATKSISTVDNFITVHMDKLDLLMDMVGEMVISEAMVTQNPEILELKNGNLFKASRQLHKITNELQDLVMSIRMVPLTATFSKMNRIVRDMCKKLNKDVHLELIGADTEMDKKIIENISDPLMHLIRNSLDHGIETPEEREAKDKNPKGTITLSASNSGSDVLIVIKDDGKGLSRNHIIEKALANGLIQDDPSTYSDQEIFKMILSPGFSTKENITEFSGRGVGMDVVVSNLDKVGGKVIIDSVEGTGTTITLKIPLTLAIIDGMNIKVGSAKYTIPIISIQESFRPNAGEVFVDNRNNEMIMVRGECYPIVRLHEFYNIETKITDFSEGILMMVEQDGKSYCLFADQLLSQQQVVVKTLPEYIKTTKRIKGLAGCTLLGDGSISLILNVGEMIN